MWQFVNQSYFKTSTERENEWIKIKHFYTCEYGSVAVSLFFFSNIFLNCEIASKWMTCSAWKPYEYRNFRISGLVLAKDIWHFVPQIFNVSIPALCWLSEQIIISMTAWWHHGDHHLSIRWIETKITTISIKRTAIWHMDRASTVVND